MRINYLIILLVFSSNVALSQEYFFKIFDFVNYSITPKQIIHYKGRTFATIGHFCYGNECSSLIELNSFGDTLWMKTNMDMDIAYKSMLIDNDTITLTGNNYPINSLFRMAHYDLKGNQLEETIEIEDPYQEYRCFQLSTQKTRDRFNIIGNGYANDSMYSLLYVVDALGNLDTALTIYKSDKQCIPSDSDIDNNGNLVTFHSYEGSYFEDNKKVIITHDSNYNVIDQYETDIASGNFTISRGAVLNNGNIIFTQYTPQANHRLKTLTCIDQNHNIVWEYSPEKVSTSQRNYSVKVLSNGDILGYGMFSDNGVEPKARDLPYIFRMSTDGHMLWERIFYEYDENRGTSRVGLVRDVAELPNGDLYGIGYLTYEYPQAMFFKVNANGCLYEEDCSVIQFLSSSSDVHVFEDIKVFPNPARDLIFIENNSAKKLNYVIIDQFGRTIRESFTLSQGTTSTNISDLGTGIYYIIVHDGHRQIKQLKFSKV